MPLIQLVSDVHSRWDRVKISKKAGIIVAAGDLAEDMDGVKWLRSFRKPAIYIPGNHEYYGSDLGLRLAEMERAAAGSKVAIMDRKTAIFGENRLICATLWTDQGGMDPLLIAKSSAVMNDYRNIGASAWMAIPENAARYGALRRRLMEQSREIGDIFPEKPTHMNPLISICLHQESLRFIEQELRKPWKGKTWVFTHHAPSSQSLIFGGYFATTETRLFHTVLHRKRRPHKISAYASSLETLFSKRRIDLWAHGHLHEGLRYSIFGSDVITNPTGYTDAQNSSYLETLLLDPSDALRHKKTLARTIERSCSMQVEMLSLLGRCVPPTPALGEALFQAREDFDAFCLIYNQAIAALLQASAEDLPPGCRQPAPINPAQILAAIPASPGGAIHSAYRIAASRTIIASAKENLNRCQHWLSSVLEDSDLAGWSLANDVFSE